MMESICVAQVLKEITSQMKNTNMFFLALRQGLIHDIPREGGDPLRSQSSGPKLNKVLQ